MATSNAILVTGGAGYIGSHTCKSLAAQGFLPVVFDNLRTGHADFVQPFEFLGLMRLVPEAAFDVMLEAKAKDLALLRLRRDLPRYAPDVALRFGLEPRADGPVEPDAEAEED